MTEVFLSYSRTDRPVAEATARELQRLGVDVWWDHELLGGDDYRRRISEILARVQVAIVIWSRRSVDSQWVISEAAAAREKKVLVPVTIDGAELPIDFRALHTIDLSAWVPGDQLPDTLMRGGQTPGARARLRRACTAIGAIARLAKQAQGWYLDFEAAVLSHRRGFAASWSTCRWSSCFAPTDRAPRRAAWTAYLFSLMNGVIAPLYAPGTGARLGIAILVRLGSARERSRLHGRPGRGRRGREIIILVRLATWPCSSCLHRPTGPVYAADPPRRAPGIEVPSRTYSCRRPRLTAAPKEDP